MSEVNTLWARFKNNVANRFGQPTDSGVKALNAHAKSIRIKQLLYLGGGATVIFLGGLSLYLSGDEGAISTKKEKPSEKMVHTLATPLIPLDERETWVNRVEKKAESVRQEANQIRQENELLLKRVDVLEELFKTHTPAHSTNTQTGSDNQNTTTTTSSIDSKDQNTSLNIQTPLVPTGPFQRFPPPNSIPNEVSSGINRGPFDSQILSLEKNATASLPNRKGPKIAHITGGRLSGVALKSPDTYLPAGTYCKAVVDMGVAASTAINSQGNPEPIKLRLVDDGNLPGGVKGHVRDAVLIGACYGDISSERARCRLETITWKDKNGTQIEKPIEGWVVGEDGLAGLRGKVVDRSGDIAREAFGAGLLSAAANFLKFEATAGVYPMTPFGQTNALSKAGALKGAAASGAGNALDKLADFSIKRAEQMQPVILVASGRVVDVLLKSGVSLTPESDSDMKVVSIPSSNSKPENTPLESRES